MGSPASLPQRIGRYEIESELGRGAMGVVYRAHDPTIGRTVAVKTVSLDANDPEVARRFRQEAKAAGILSHPGIVTIYDAGEENGLFYIAMELVEGETLQHRLLRGPLALDEALEVVRAVGAALDHAHTRNIIHRDVKPANIVLSENAVKVMDFGVAKMCGTTLTSTGQIFGTPAYISPELLKGVAADARADIFSVGVVLYEMLTGKKPFNGDNISTIIYKIMGEQPELPASIAPHLNPALDRVVLKALAKNRDERYSTCAELVADLERVRDGLTPLAAPVERVRGGTESLAVPVAQPSTEATAPKRSRAGVFAAVIACIAIVAVAGGWWMRRQQRSAETEKITLTTAPPAPQSSAQQRAPAQNSQNLSQPVGQAAPSATAAGAAQAPAQTLSAKPSPFSAQTAAPPKTESQAKTGYPVSVSSNVTGATISIDGKPQPVRTPAELQLAPGAHNIELSKEGYESSSQELRVGPKGPSSLSIQLRAAEEPSIPPAQAGWLAAGEFGRVRIASLPPNAVITVDGRKTRFRTPVNLPFPTGKHTITLQHSGYEDLHHDVTVQKNQMSVLKLVLKAKRKKRLFIF